VLQRQKSGYSGWFILMAQPYRNTHRGLTWM
jgi:hydroxypyruvate isomerase